MTAETTEDTLFTKIINGDIPCDKVYETDTTFAFRDINPQAPEHILVIPKTPVAKHSDVDDPQIYADVMSAARDIAKQLNLDDYRLVINNGAAAGQTVFHLHVHILAGRPFAWPPG